MIINPLRLLRELALVNSRLEMSCERLELLAVELRAELDRMQSRPIIG